MTITDPSITYLSKSKIGGCGKLITSGELSGECECVDGKWRASLSISLTGEIHVANDTLITPKRLIIWHERRHWAAKVQAVQQAKTAGERVEATPFSSKPDCQAAVSALQSEWYPKIAQAGAHNDWTATFWALTCE